MQNNYLLRNIYLRISKYSNPLTRLSRNGTFGRSKLPINAINVITRLMPKSRPTLILSSFFAYPFVVNAWLKDPKADEKKILQQADQLFDANEFDKLMQLLKSQPIWYDNADVLWRVARCEYHISKRTSPNDPQIIKSAYEHVKKALELNNECGPAHKWAAILLNAVSTLQGTRAKIEQVLNVREHMEKAIKYSPDDPTSHYLLGEWHYSCYQVTWAERKIAAIVFGSLPDANLEIGLHMLEKAEEIESNFYSKNKVLIAKTLIALKRDPERAKSLLITVVGKYKNSEKWDDIEAVKEAKQTLKQLGVKIEEIHH